MDINKNKISIVKNILKNMGFNYSYKFIKNILIIKDMCLDNCPNKLYNLANKITYTAVVKDRMGMNKHILKLEF
jgi:hypothetical protein